MPTTPQRAFCGDPREGLRIAMEKQVWRDRRYGQPWADDELLVAWEACPKDFQRYGSRDPKVVEVAELLGRSPAAVSRIFGNFWWVYSGHSLGLPHASHSVERVVTEYGNDPTALAKQSFEARAGRVKRSVWPRVLVKSDEPAGAIPFWQIASLAADNKVDLRNVYVNPRGGSIIEDIFMFVTGNPGATLSSSGILVRPE